MRSLVVLMIVVASHGRVLAQGAEDDAAKADKLFEEGQKLKQAGKTAEACQKYEESLRLNKNAVGTLLNVALCDEEAGKTASALKYFTQARDLAREHNLAEHKKAAEEHIAKNQPLVPHLAIAIADPAPDTKLVIDADAYPLDQAGDILIDPGTHRINVSAPGRVAYETTVTIEIGKPKAIAVPKLGYPVVYKKTRRTIGRIATLTGAGLITTGVVLGIVARQLYHKQIDNGNCTDDSPPMCNADGYAGTNTARTYGNVGTVVGGVGVVAFGVGAYLWFFGPKEQPERGVAVVPTLDNQSAGLTAIGHF
jgi:hypothetical protein